MWIHLPSTSCQSALGTVDSTSDLTLQQAERLARSATLSGKQVLPRYWRLAWRKKSWLRLLSGATCEHSTADLGVASWISSLAAIRASRSVTPASALASKMSDIYGPTSLASLARLCPASSSSRMSPDTSLSDSMLFAPTLSASAIELRRDYSRRLKLAQAIAANASLSSAWPTPRAEDAASCGQHPGAMDALNKTAEHWPTPRTITGGGESAARKQELGRMNSGGGDLQAAAMQWPTPGANDHKGSAREGQRRGQLDEAAEQLWQTPTVGFGGKMNRSKERSGEFMIEGQATALTSSLQAQPTSTLGDESSPTDPTLRPRLNPAFVEWLMGLPTGWTDFAPLGTEWCRWSRRMHSYLFGLVFIRSKP